MTILPDGFYAEALLVRELGFSKEWLRGTVGSLQGGKRRVYLGARILECLKPCPPTASKSTSAPEAHSGTPAVTLRAKVAKSVAGQPASPLGHGGKSQRALLAEWRRNAPNVSPLKRTG